MLLQETDGVVGDGVGVVEVLRLILRIVLRRDKRVLTAQGCRIIVTAAASDRSVELLEPALHRPIRFVSVRANIAADMPLAAHVGAIPRGAQDLRNGYTLPVQLTAITLVTK